MVGDTAPLAGRQSSTFWQPIGSKDGMGIWCCNCSTEAEALEAIAARESQVH
jgi:hypothetical protein